jgi:serine/threonine protein kinase
MCPRMRMTKRNLRRTGDGAFCTRGPFALYANYTNLVICRVGEYLLGKTLGEGSFGKVRLATRNGELFAIKIVSKDSIDTVADIERVYRETFILTTLKHTNIIKLYEVLLSLSLSLSLSLVETVALSSLGNKINQLFGPSPSSPPPPHSRPSGD